MTAEKRIRIIHYGLGPIGIETARLVLKKSNMDIVGAVDISKEMAGRDLGEILRLDRDLGVVVTDDAASLFKKVRADVVLHTAGSRLKKIYPQLEGILRAKMNVASSAEELLFPSGENARIAAGIHQLALDHGVTVLGTGVNPGFVMDALPLVLTGICQEVRQIHVTRVVDAGTRRYPLQKKVGAGMTPQTFVERIAKKELGHVGLLESLNLISHKLGMALDSVNETIEPVLADRPVKTRYFSLQAGDVAGIKHRAEGIRGGEKVITLDLRMYIGAEDPHDAVRIIGTPNIQVTIEGGVAGDQATAAILVNSVPTVIDARPGLTTVKDVPSPHFYK
jgi:hypothetical protein